MIAAQKMFVFFLFAINNSLKAISNCYTHYYYGNNNNPT